MDIEHVWVDEWLNAGMTLHTEQGNLEWAFFFSEIYCQKKEISVTFWKTQKWKCLYLCTLLVRSVTEILWELCKICRAPTGVPSICAYCCFADTGCFCWEKHWLARKQCVSVRWCAFSYCSSNSPWAVCWLIGHVGCVTLSADF